MEHNYTFSQETEEREKRWARLKKLAEKQGKRSKAFHLALAAYVVSMISLFCVSEFHTGWIMWVAYTAFGAEVVFGLLMFIYPFARKARPFRAG